VHPLQSIAAGRARVRDVPGGETAGARFLVASSSENFSGWKH
jgi:hypothetical protein